MRLAAPELSLIDIPAERGSFYTEHLASRLNEAGVQVTTSKAIGQLLGAERQRQLLGCSDGTTCVAEIASALGTDGVVFGEIAKIDSGFQLNLKVVSAKDARNFSTFQARAANETELLERLDAAAKQLSGETALALGRTITPVAHASTVPLQPIGIGVAAGGVVGIALGAVLLGLARSTAGEFPAEGEPPISSSRADGLVTTGKTYQTVGFICLGAGAALAVTGAALFVLGMKPPPARVAVLLSPGGAAIALSADF